MQHHDANATGKISNNRKRQLRILRCRKEGDTGRCKEEWEEGTGEARPGKARHVVRPSLQDMRELDMQHGMPNWQKAHEAGWFITGFGTHPWIVVPGPASATNGRCAVEPVVHGARDIFPGLPWLFCDSRQLLTSTDRNDRSKGGNFDVFGGEELALTVLRGTAP